MTSSDIFTKLVEASSFGKKQVIKNLIKDNFNDINVSELIFILDNETIKYIKSLQSTHH